MANSAILTFLRKHPDVRAEELHHLIVSCTGENDRRNDIAVPKGSRSVEPTKDPNEPERKAIPNVRASPVPVRPDPPIHRETSPPSDDGGPSAALDFGHRKDASKRGPCQRNANQSKRPPTGNPKKLRAREMVDGMDDDRILNDARFDLREQNMFVLHQVAARLDVRGYSKMNKNDLVAKIEERREELSGTKTSDTRPARSKAPVERSPRASDDAASERSSAEDGARCTAIRRFDATISPFCIELDGHDDANGSDDGILRPLIKRKKTRSGDLRNRIQQNRLPRTLPNGSSSPRYRHVFNRFKRDACANGSMDFDAGYEACRDGSCSPVAGAEIEDNDADGNRNPDEDSHIDADADIDVEGEGDFDGDVGKGGTKKTASEGFDDDCCSISETDVGVDDDETPSDDEYENPTNDDTFTDNDQENAIDDTVDDDDEDNADRKRRPAKVTGEDRRVRARQA